LKSYIRTSLKVIVSNHSKLVINLYSRQLIKILNTNIRQHTTTTIIIIIRQ